MGMRCRPTSRRNSACGKTEWQVHAYCLMRNHFFRQETTLSLKRIAARLQMGTWTYVSNLLNEPQRRSPKLRRCCRCVNSEGDTYLTPKTAVEMAAKERKERKINVWRQVRPHFSIHLPGDNTIRHNSFSLRSL